MSAESIARWNAIPLTRPDSESEASHAMKRPRPEDDEDSDDNVSLVSRSPSPQPSSDAMDIDKYDEYVSAPVRETITVESKIKSSNKGFLMLAGMGWIEGQPLGLSGDGRVDPVPFYVKNDLTGLGKTTQDVRMIETTVAQRRELDSERQTKETEEQRRAREDSVARRAAVQSEISSTLRAFYCELCDKQFQNVAQYDEHTNSYAHHHKARFRDMQAAARASRNTQEEVDKRKEKERKREEKELRKLAKAVGIKLAKPPVALVTTTSNAGTDSTGNVSSPAPTASESPAPTAATSSSAFTKTGWSSLGGAASGPSRSHEPGPSGGWAPVAATSSQPSQLPDAVHRQTGPAPAFRTGGWTSLETGSSECAPPPPASMPPTPPTVPTAEPHLLPLPAQPGSMPPLNTTACDWAHGSTPSAPSQPSRGGWQTVPQVPPSRPAASHADDTHGIPIPTSRPAVQSRPKPTARQEASRSGWQQFSAAGPGKRK